ncbi:MAG: hypothetical protein JJU30_13670 [Alkalimonas sp.]|nr:hypothetical protein [Alkalimonas sp.]
MMNSEDFRLYVDSEVTYHATFKEAEEAAQPFMPRKAELRIEILAEIEPGEADFWAYNYDKQQWEPS